MTIFLNIIYYTLVAFIVVSCLYILKFSIQAVIGMCINLLNKTYFSENLFGISGQSWRTKSIRNGIMSLGLGLTYFIFYFNVGNYLKDIDTNRFVMLLVIGVPTIFTLVILKYLSRYLYVFNLGISPLDGYFSNFYINAKFTASREGILSLKRKEIKYANKFASQIKLGEMKQSYQLIFLFTIHTIHSAILYNTRLVSARYLGGGYVKVSALFIYLLKNRRFILASMGYSNYYKLILYIKSNNTLNGYDDFCDFSTKVLENIDIDKRTIEKYNQKLEIL